MLTLTTIIGILKLLPTLIAAVQAVEGAIPLPSSGKAKLDLVLGAVTDAYSSGQQAIQEIPGDRLVALVAQTITRVVNTFNALGLFKKN